MPILLVNDSAVGQFCCSEGLDANTTKCIIATLGSSKPFELDPGQIILDRSNGATVGSNLEPATTTVTATAQPSAATAAGTQPPSSKRDDTLPIILGISIPLGILLLVAVIVICWLWRRTNSINKHSLATQKGSDTSETTPSSNSLHDPADSPLSSRDTYEIHARDICEASPEAQAHELRSRPNRVEVAGSPPIEMYGARPVEADGTPLDWCQHWTRGTSHGQQFKQGNTSNNDG